MDMIIPGSLLSFNSMKRNWGSMGRPSVFGWSILERLHYCFRMEPFSGSCRGALRHASKLYLWDWSAVDDSALRFENLVACALLRWCHFAQDWGGKDL